MNKFATVAPTLTVTLTDEQLKKLAKLIVKGLKEIE